MTYRCTPASSSAGEPLLGTAPTDRAWLLVEHDGPWGRQAVAESALPAEVRDFLGAVEGVRVQLVRRHGRTVRDDGLRVFTAYVGESGPARVETTVVGDARELLGIDVAALAEGRSPGLTAHGEPLWLVCTNGRRDLCCADLGRPVTAALAARWPEATWETTHLGGHRFAATLLALPAGLVLGRLDAASAVEACADLEAGGVTEHYALPTGSGRYVPFGSATVAGVLRGRVGRPGPVQVAEVAVAGAHTGPASAPAERPAEREGEREGGETVVRVSAPDGAAYDVRVRSVLGEPRRQSCADLAEKPAVEHHLVDVVRAPEERP